jgi:hypothetical protein
MGALKTETAPKPVRRVTDLQRSAFWIYGVTAMVMRDPLGVVVRQTAELGLGNWEVRLEILRVAVILILLARLFLVSGIYFEQVYMQPGSADLYPRSSFAVDFLAGLAQFLVATAASTAISLQSIRTLTPFSLLVAIFLAIDWLWLGLAAVRRFSSLPIIARQAQFNARILGAGALALVVSRLVGGDAVFDHQAALSVVALIAVVDIALQIRRYDELS